VGRDSFVFVLCLVLFVTGLLPQRFSKLRDKRPIFRATTSAQSSTGIAIRSTVILQP
jgi:hypothetical protein